MQRVQSSITRGQTAEWNVNAWVTGENASNVSIKLTGAPSGMTPTFSFGCVHNGTATCSLGTVDANSVARQLRAQIKVAASATSVKSVQLTATESAAKITTDPRVSVSIPVTAPSPSSSPTPTSTPTPPSTTSPAPAGNVTSTLPVGSLPYLNGSGSTLNPGGNASGLFPTLNPAAGSSPGGQQSGNANARPVADTSALPEGTSVIGAQLVGLGALALAFILAITRLSLRRRPALAVPSAPASPTAPAAPPAPKPPAAE